jgi:hypothetical protein
LKVTGRIEVNFVLRVRKAAANHLKTFQRGDIKP